MIYQIHLTDDAKLNIKAASDYYSEISTPLQERFQIDLIKTIDKLKENPKHHQIRYKSIRIAHIKTFPYGVHFIIESSTVRVLKILHHKRFYNKSIIDKNTP